MLESVQESKSLNWYKVLDNKELLERRIKAVTCAHTTVRMTHFEGKYTTLDNKCPHQGKPLGESSIEKVGYAALGMVGTTAHLQEILPTVIIMV